MSVNFAILDLSATHTLNAICEAATTGKSFYIDKRDDSLVCDTWFPALFDQKLRVADLSAIIKRVDDALTCSERMIELHAGQAAYEQSVYRLASAALRACQVFEAAKYSTSPNRLINECAQKHQPTFHLPVGTKGCATGLARVFDPPKRLVGARGPNRINGRYFYHGETDYLKGLLRMAEIGLRTQLERIASLATRVLQAITRVFGFPLNQLNGVHYFRNNETSNNIYDASRLPISFNEQDASRFSSFWIGHASCFFSVPVQSDTGSKSRINIVTDPIEEDIDQWLYPRMTEPGKLLEQCPPVHVCLLTHNHRDHLSPQTLQKLRGFDPLIVFPKGDGERIRSLGFSRVIETEWFEQVSVEVPEVDGETYHLTITATPANHGSGNLSQSRRTSLFNGYAIQSKALDGDIYFAGDTARLDTEHTNALRDLFNIRYNFQPGGPDEIRALNVDDHQASCDGLLMHLHLMVQKAHAQLSQQLKRPPTFEELQAASTHLQTIYMHTKTYKLGNLHFDDTDVSIRRVLNWLEQHGSWESLQLPQPELAQHEIEALQEMADTKGSHCIFVDNHPLRPNQIAVLLRHHITIPKIGALFQGSLPR